MADLWLTDDRPYPTLIGHSGTDSVTGRFRMTSDISSPKVLTIDETHPHLPYFRLAQDLLRDSADAAAKVENHAAGGHVPLPSC